MDIKRGSGLAYIQGWTEDGSEKENTITVSKINSLVDMKNGFSDYAGVCWRAIHNTGRFAAGSLAALCSRRRPDWSRKRILILI